MTAPKWPVGDPHFEPLFRDLITNIHQLLAAYDTYCNHGITRLEDAANEETA
jgi:hypothetical protein